MRLTFIFSLCLFFFFSSGYSHDPATGISTQVSADPQQSTRAFPWYSAIILGVQGIYEYLDVNTPVWVRVVWWGAFVAEDGGVLDTAMQIRHAFLICHNSCFDSCANNIVDVCGSCLLKMAYLLLVNRGNYKPSLILFAAYIIFLLFQAGR